MRHSKLFDMFIQLLSTQKSIKKVNDIKINKENSKQISTYQKYQILKMVTRICYMYKSKSLLTRQKKHVSLGPLTIQL